MHDYRFRHVEGKHVGKQCLQIMKDTEWLTFVFNNTMIHMEKKDLEV